MKTFIRLLLPIFFIGVVNTAEYTEIEECVSINDDSVRLSCFDSFFETDKNLVLVDQQEIIFEENPSSNTEEETKLVVKADRTFIDKNLMLTGVRFTGVSYIFELNDQSFWRNVESLRKKDIPTPGDKVELQSGMFGSTFLKIKGKKNKIRIKKERN